MEQELYIRIRFPNNSVWRITGHMVAVLRAEQLGYKYNKPSYPYDYWYQKYYLETLQHPIFAVSWMKDRGWKELCPYCKEIRQGPDPDYINMFKYCQIEVYYR